MAAGKVLLVDDQPALLAALTEHLQEWGYDVVSVASAAEALALLQQPEHGVGMVVSDYHLRGVELGTDIARWLKQNSNSMPFVLVTTSDGIAEFTRMQEDGLISGFCGKLSAKPLKALLGQLMAPSVGTSPGAGASIL